MDGYLDWRKGRKVNEQTGKDGATEREGHGQVMQDEWIVGWMNGCSGWVNVQNLRDK